MSQFKPVTREDIFRKLEKSLTEAHDVGIYVNLLSLPEENFALINDTNGTHLTIIFRGFPVIVAKRELISSQEAFKFFKTEIVRLKIDLGTTNAGVVYDSPAYLVTTKTGEFLGVWNTLRELTGKTNLNAYRMLNTGFLLPVSLEK